MEMDVGQKPKLSLKTKANILAIASLTIVPLWWVIVLILWDKQKTGDGYGALYSGWYCGFAAILCSILSLIFTRKVKASLWTMPVAISGLLIAIYLNFGFTHILSEVLEGRREDCERNLKTLSTAIKVYGEKHNGEFPAPAKWCDLLLSEHPQESDGLIGLYWKLSKESFQCEGGSAIKTGEKLGYAFNTNLASKRISEVDPNVVVIFESNTVGWNLNGDSKIMNPNRHMNFLGENGSCVLRANQYDVKFVPQSEVKNLRWNP
jgi:hypothetical protein